MTRSNLERLNRITRSNPLSTASQNDLSTNEESLNEDIPSIIQETYPDIAFDFEWGYLPPLDADTLAILGVLFANQPSVSKALKMVSKREFETGLKSRNVHLKESDIQDPCQDQILQTLSQDQAFETDAEKNAYGTLWALDQANCMGKSNEAIFQRTVMMNLIARHLLIYKKDASTPRVLEISVEELWTCPPAPSRSFDRGEGSLLTKPKPDLAVSFCCERLLPNISWMSLPTPTQRLASYESPCQSAREKVFHFLTIEAKKGMTSADDCAALLQSLKNASQSLYNMYEFFREAGPVHEKEFFDGVRFFSIVATTEGLTFRIHRATRVAEKADMVTDEYPIQFEYRVLKRVLVGNDYSRDTVIEIMRHILLGYAEEKLLKLLKGAAEAVHQKFADKVARKHRQMIGYDLYGDSKPSKKPSKNLDGGSTKPSNATYIHDLSMQSGTQVSHMKQKRRRTLASDNGQSRRYSDLAGHSSKRQK